MAQLHILASILANNQCDKAAYHLSLLSPDLAFDKELTRALLKTNYFKNQVLENDKFYQDLKVFELDVRRFRFFMSCGYTVEPNALFHASYKKNYNLAKYLVETGADVNWKDSDPDDNNETLLMFVTRWGNGLQYLKLFVENGANIDGADDNDVTALMVASWRGRTEIVRYLIEKGADVNGLGGAAYLAMFDGDICVPILKLLFTHGADINAKDEDGETMLHKACKHKKCPYDLIELLLSAGADVNARDDQSSTPLMYAISNSECTMFTLELLLKHGADIYLYRWNNETCFDIAICRCRSDAVYFMLKYELEIRGKRMSLNKLLKFCFPAELRNDILMWLLRNGADINETNVHNETPLIVAARMVKDVDLFELLLDAGANISHMDEAGHTAFYYAALLMHTKIIKLLARRFGCVLLTKSEKAEIIRKNGIAESQKLIKTLYKLGSIDQMSMEQLKV